MSRKISEDKSGLSPRFRWLAGAVFLRMAIRAIGRGIRCSGSRRHCRRAWSAKAIITASLLSMTSLRCTNSGKTLLLGRHYKMKSEKSIILKMYLELFLTSAGVSHLYLRCMVIDAEEQPQLGKVAFQSELYRKRSQQWYWGCSRNRTRARGADWSAVRKADVRSIDLNNYREKTL